MAVAERFLVLTRVVPFVLILSAVPRNMRELMQFIYIYIYIYIYILKTLCLAYTDCQNNRLCLSLSFFKATTDNTKHSKAKGVSLSV